MLQRVERRAVREYAVLSLGVLLTALVASLFALRRHDVYSTAGFDLGIYDQAIWLWSRFEPAVSTIRRVPNLFGDHFHPALMLYAPLQWFGDGTRNLLVGQTLVVTAAAFPIFRFARRRLAFAPALLLAVAYLTSWGVAIGLALDIHDTSWSALALAMVLETYDRRARWPLAGAVLFLLLTREDQSLAVGMLGVIALFSAGRRREGAALLIAGFIWFIVAIKIVIPHFNLGRFEHWEYRNLAPDVGGLVLLALQKPWVILKALVVPKVKLDTMIRTVAAFGFLPLLSPYALLLLPTLAATLLSDTPARWEPYFHYWMPASVVGAVAAADGLGRLRARLAKRSPESENASTEKKFAPLIVGLASVALLLGLRLSRHAPQRNLFRPLSPDDLQIARDGDRLLSALPPDASVSATNNALGHLAHRRDVYFLRSGGFDAPGFTPVRAEYVIVDPRALRSGGDWRGHPFHDPDYELVRREGEWYLFHLRPGRTWATGFQPQADGRSGRSDLRTADPVRR